MITPRLELPGVEVYIGDAKATALALSEKYRKKVNAVVTSPPYYRLRRYLPMGHPDADKEIGQEQSVEEFVSDLCDLFNTIGDHLLREDGSLWCNLSDGYAGSGGAGGDYNAGGLRAGQPKWKPAKDPWPAKSLMMVPFRFALAMAGATTFTATDAAALLGIAAMLEQAKAEQDWGMVDQAREMLIAWVNEKRAPGGWILRNIVIWFKGKDVDDPLDDEEGGAPTSNGMPTSVEDRLKNTYEVIFHFSRQQRYFYDLNAIREPTVGQNQHDLTGGRYAPPGQTEHTPRERKMVQEMYPPDKVPDHTKGRPSGVAGTSPLGRNPGDLWAIPTTPFALAHFATYPPALVHRPVKATCPEAVCKKCGAPRMPIWEKGREYQSGSGRAGRTAGDIIGKGDDHLGGQVRSNHDLRLGPIPVGRITGYTDCGCGAGWEGGIVLDPFMGSGTTAQGAFEARPPKTIDGHLCQVKVIGIDLDERNLPIIEKRLTGRAKQGRKVDLSKYNGGFLAAAEQPE